MRVDHIPAEFQAMGIVIIDPDMHQANMLKVHLDALGFHQIMILKDAQLIGPKLFSNSIDLIFLKLGAEHLDAFEMISYLKRKQKNAYIPLIALLDEKDAKYKQVALSKGASDVFMSPYQDALHRIKNLLETRHLHKEYEKEKALLEKKAEASVVQLERTQIEMSVRLALAAEYRDDESGEHVWRVAHTSWLLGLELGLSADHAELLLRAARLHDVGKIGIPDSILLKPSKLTDLEFEVIKTHTTIGAKLLTGGESELLKLAETIALTHHERWDGSGYPHGLKAEAIPLEGQIVGLADTFDALTSDRVHQKAWTIERAFKEIKAFKGIHFSARLVDAFVNLYFGGALPYDINKPTYLPPQIKTNMLEFD